MLRPNGKVRRCVGTLEDGNERLLEDVLKSFSPFHGPFQVPTTRRSTRRRTTSAAGICLSAQWVRGLLPKKPCTKRRFHRTSTKRQSHLHILGNRTIFLKQPTDLCPAALQNLVPFSCRNLLMLPLLPKKDHCQDSNRLFSGANQTQLSGKSA